MDLSYGVREHFHLLFLRHLAGRLAGRPYSLKGGVCLRFFHRSQRLSEDIDFDIGPQVPTGTLAKAIDSLLEARSFRASLLSAGITGFKASKPKQTETVQRWKIGLALEGGHNLPTKLEFSRRSRIIPFICGIPDPEIREHHKVPPFSAQYYNAATVARKKIEALASTSRNAVRDLFDLYHLVKEMRVDLIQVAKSIPEREVQKAVDKFRNFSFRDFQEQVLPFLPSSMIAYFALRGSFDDMKSQMEHSLEDRS